MRPTRPRFTQESRLQKRAILSTTRCEQRQHRTGSNTKPFIRTFELLRRGTSSTQELRARRITGIQILSFEVVLGKANLQNHNQIKWSKAKPLEALRCAAAYQRTRACVMGQ